MEKKILKIAIVMVLLVFVYSSVVNALSFTATMTPSKTTVPESTEFTVSVKVSNLDVGANGINSLSGYLKYDQSIFEKIGDTSIEALSGWSVSYNAENEKVALTKTSFVKTEESVFQVTFKTKSEIAEGKSGKIEFTNIVASNSASDINASDISITINIGEESTEEGNGSSGANVTGGTENKNTTANKANTTISVSTDKKNTNTNTNTNTNANENKTTNTNTNKNTNANTNKSTVSGSYNNSTNTSAEDIPYTGAEDTLMIVMGAILILAFVFYIKFERINKEMK